MVYDEKSFQSLLDYTKNYFKLIEQKDKDVQIIDIFRGKRRSPDWPGGKICYLWKKIVKNAFGLEDFVLYYMIAKKGWFGNWASEDNADSAKFRNTDGCTFPSSIYAHMELYEKRSQRAVFVVGILDPITKDKVSFHYITVPELFKFIRKYGTIFNSRFEQEMVGMPKSILTEVDPFK